MDCDSPVWDAEDQMAWDETTRHDHRRVSARYPSDMTDQEWAVIAPLLPPPKLGVRMRDVLGASDHLKRLGQAAGIEWRIVTGVSVGGEHSQALGHDPLRGSALEHALATSVVGLIEAAQQGLQILVAGHRDAQHLALDASVEAFDHAIRARRVGPRRAMLHPELLARCLEAVSREAGAAIREP